MYKGSGVNKTPPYIEFEVTSNFSFLRGGSHPEELMSSARSLGYSGIALTDLHSFAGIVRAHFAAKEAGIPLFVGTRIEIHPTLSLLLYPATRAAYGTLCSLLTT